MEHKNEQFETGAVRDTAEGKPRMDLISPFFMRDLGNWLRVGSQRYKDRNWEMGIPMMRCVASLLRHTWQWVAHDEEEDHLAAIACNIMFIIHYREMIKRGRLSRELDDRPDYKEEANETA